jgi:hypothetical protein
MAMRVAPMPKRTFKAAADVRGPKPYLNRNRHIVRETALLIAVPNELTEQPRSGTWSTVRYAQRLGWQGPFLAP